MIGCDNSHHLHAEQSNQNNRDPVSDPMYHTSLFGGESTITLGRSAGNQTHYHRLSRLEPALPSGIYHYIYQCTELPNSA